MWDSYGREPMDLKLMALQLGRKLWILLVSSLVGVLLIGGPYFLRHVVFAPARQYQAVMDFYVDYAKQADGTEYTYFNQTTWTQLMQDDVFTDKILTALSEDKNSKTMPDKDTLKRYLNATMLSDTRIVTTTVTTPDPQLTMEINAALIKAFDEFAQEQKEIADFRILQQPDKATLVVADVRTFRACMLGLVLADFLTICYLLLYATLDDSIYLPVTFEKRYGIPMVGTVHSEELRLMMKQFFTKPPILVTADESVDADQVKMSLKEHAIDTDVSIDLSGSFVETVREQLIASGNLLLVVEAGAHNGKKIEKTLEICAKCGSPINAALLWDADEKLIRAYYLPQHVFHRSKKREQKTK